MSAYIALPKLTLIAALFILSLDESRAASLSDLSSLTSAAKPETTIIGSDVRQNVAAHGGGDSTYKGKTETVAHPELKPDYPCQNLHVREPSCPPR